MAYLANFANMYTYMYIDIIRTRKQFAAEYFDSPEILNAEIYFIVWYSIEKSF